MELLRELLNIQEARGWVSDDDLREMSQRRRVPLYRLEGLVSFYTHFRRTPPPKRTFHVCRDVCCAMHWEPDQLERLEKRAAADGDDFEIHEVSCLGRCDGGGAYTLSTVEDGRTTTVIEGGEVPRREINARCNPYPTSDDRYGTVNALAGDLGQLSATCIDRLTQAGLRGMGGAGFPTGKKWELVAAERSTPKYVICNADESEPGTFKDREILAQLPHLVIEGMVLAGLTVGAERGIVFIRHEYEPERQALEAELERAREIGIIGEDAAGCGRAFDIEVFVSPGGYILGEETALLEALEDKRGEPRNKPPYPGQHGLWGQPTLINNVETFALATAIIHHGHEWWAEQGKEGFKGLKFVCISGDVAEPGVYEIPVGTTAGELIEMAEGMAGDKSLKAFLPGGASSNFLTAADAETPLDFDAIKRAGSMLGTGAVIVCNEDRDLFALATNLVKFFRNESCGKCVPCRIGTQRAVEMLESYDPDTRSLEDTGCLSAVLSEINETLEQTSICGLGQVALHPVTSLLQRFPEG